MNIRFCPFRTTEYGSGTQAECNNQCALFDEDTGYCSLAFLPTIGKELYNLRTIITSDSRIKEETQDG